jgi:uncharacterized protein YxjI
VKELTQTLLEATELILIKKILSVRRHYDFVNLQGTKLGEAKGNIVQVPPKFTVIDHQGNEIMHLHGKEFSKEKEYIFYSSMNEPIGNIKSSETDDLQFWVEKDGHQFMNIHQEFPFKSILETLASSQTPSELLKPMLNYIMEVDGQTVANVHRKWPTLRNQIKFSITGPVDHRLVIGAIIVIEHVLVEGK